MMKRMSFLLLCMILLCGCSKNGNVEPPVAESVSVSTEPIQEVPTAETAFPIQTSTPVETIPEFSELEKTEFLAIEDHVPSYDPSVQFSFPIVSGEKHDSLQTAYYHIDSYGHLVKGSGIFRICTDPPEMNQGSHYGVFQMTDGGLMELPRYTFSKVLEFQGQNYNIEFEYCCYENEIIITYISALAEDFRILDTTLRNGKCLISIPLNIKDVLQIDYPILLDVETGTLVDFLEGISRESMLNCLLDDLDLSRFYTILNAVFLEDNRLLVEMNGNWFYLYDAVAGTVHDLGSMSGYELTDCAIAGEYIVCWNDAGDYWKIHPDTLEVRDILLDVPFVEFTSGIWQGSGCSFTLYRDEARNLHVYDFLTDTDQILPEPSGWTLEGYSSHPSPDGRKLLFFQGNQSGTYQLLIFDCDRMQFCEIKRENTNAIRESLIQWTQDNAVVVISDTNQDFYVYQWKEMKENVSQPMQYLRQNADFVAVREYIPDVMVDLKYAQSDNFTGQTIYEFDDVYLRYGTIRKLVEVQQELKEMGLGIKIWDGFRPVSAQFKLWEIYPDDTYVANPNVGFSNHSRGFAVDLTLVDSHGKELPMPTEFDDFSGRADRDYSDCDPVAAENALLLQNIMEKHGFAGYYGEWWHFNDTTRYEVEHCFDPSLISRWYAECEEFISLRTAPDTNAEVVLLIPAGGEFTRLGKTGDFYLVEYQGQRGYVLSSYTSPVVP